MRIQNFLKDVLKDARYKGAYSTISFAFFAFLVEILAYDVLIKFNLKQYWLLLPLGIYILGATFAKHIKIVRIVIGSLEISSILSFALLCIGIRNEYVAELVKSRFEIIAIAATIALFVNLYVSRNSTPKMLTQN